MQLQSIAPCPPSRLGSVSIYQWSTYVSGLRPRLRETASTESRHAKETFNSVLRSVRQPPYQDGQRDESNTAGRDVFLL